MLTARTCLGGMITAPHHLAAETGASVLREGGNAIEAMIAAAATIAVTYPHMNGIGGDGFWLIARAGAPPVAIEACGPAAGLASAEAYRAQGLKAVPLRGPMAAVTVAGAVAGWSKALEVSKAAGGRLPMRRLVEDAVRYARDGVPVSSSVAFRSRLRWPELSRICGYTETFGPNGPLQEGAILKQPKLAATLQRLTAAGLDDFYRGDLARSMAADLEAAGSALRLDDFEAFKARFVEPLNTRLRAGNVYNLPPPAQGVTTLMILKLFERLGVEEGDSFEHLHGLVESAKRAYLVRDAGLGDPTRMSVDCRDWLDDAFIAREAGRIDRERAAPWPHPSGDGDTIWMGAADAQGTVVSYIQSIFKDFGSGIVLPDTGVLWQNRGFGFSLKPGPNELGPRRLPLHTLNPALARLDDGRTLAFGTMGGDGQPQTLATIFTRHVLFGQDMQAAITSPRWFLGSRWGAPEPMLNLESRYEEGLVDAMKTAGHRVELVAPFDELMGHAGMLSIDRGGVIRAACDPRADGSCAGN
ncbi:MAG: gamma-glutamyltransferase family protein [Alphaproteobacteria bacterium]|nr:gamma-glutamyltransferase family protein [Alphaproteobacteria bacterium]